jgi:hypothetical protein
MWRTPTAEHFIKIKITKMLVNSTYVTWPRKAILSSKFDLNKISFYFGFKDFEKTVLKMPDVKLT